MQKLRKVSSFIWRSIKITALLIFIFLLSAFFLLQLPSVQTYLGKKASAYLSHALKTKIAIRAVNIDFIKTINLEGIYVEDLHHDTLLFGDKIACSLKLFSLRKKQLEMNLTELEGLTCKLLYYKGEKSLNFQFLADYFSSPKKSENSTPSQFRFGYGNLRLRNIRFVYHDCDNRYKPAYGMDYQDIEVNGLNADFSHILIQGDSVKVKINGLSAFEKSGIQVKHLDAEATLCPRYIKADELFLQTANSYLHGSYHMYTDSFSDYNDYIKAVDMHAFLKDSSYVSFADIAYFAEELEGLDQKVRVNGHIKGSIENLSSEELTFSLLQHTAYHGKVRITRPG